MGMNFCRSARFSRPVTRVANAVCVRVQVHPGLPSATGQGERVKKQLLTS